MTSKSSQELQETHDANAKTFSGKPFTEVDFLRNFNGKRLFCKYWKHKQEHPRFLVCLVHGLGGHCARFDELALYLNTLGAFVFAHDHVGHGESEGKRTTVDEYETLTRDIIQHAEKFRQKYPDLPMFLVGQSMGGALAVIAAHQKPKLFSGVAVLGGMFTVDPQLASTFKRFLVGTVATILPNLRLSTLDESNSSRDPKEVEIVLNDPLKSSVVKSEMAYQIIRITDAIKSLVCDFSLPLLVLHGGADTTCDPEGSKWFYRNSKSEDKAVKIYDGCYHDLLHELPDEKEKCIKEIGEWLLQRVP